MLAIDPRSANLESILIRIGMIIEVAGEKGRQANAVGGGLLVVLCMSGLVIWWRGAGNWVKGLYFAPRSGWKRINFDIHSALGFWSLLILLLWGVTGV